MFLCLAECGDAVADLVDDEADCNDAYVEEGVPSACIAMVMAISAGFLGVMSP